MFAFQLRGEVQPKARPAAYLDGAAGVEALDLLDRRVKVGLDVVAALGEERTKREEEGRKGVKFHTKVHTNENHADPTLRTYQVARDVPHEVARRLEAAVVAGLGDRLAAGVGLVPVKEQAALARARVARVLPRLDAAAVHGETFLVGALRGLMVRMGRKGEFVGSPLAKARLLGATLHTARSTVHALWPPATSSATASSMAPALCQSICVCFVPMLDVRAITTPTRMPARGGRGAAVSARTPRDSCSHSLCS